MKRRASVAALGLALGCGGLMPSPTPTAPLAPSRPSTPSAPAAAETPASETPEAASAPGATAVPAPEAASAPAPREVPAAAATAPKPEKPAAKTASATPISKPAAPRPAAETSAPAPRGRLAAPWSTMRLPMDGGSVSYCDASSCTIRYPKRALTDVGPALNAAVVKAGWREKPNARTSGARDWSNQYEKDGTTLFLAGTDNGSGPDVTLLVQ